MKRRLPNITNKFWAVSAVFLLLVIWQLLSQMGVVEAFLLPTPTDVIKALVTDFPVLMEHAVVTLTEAFWGLLLGIILGFVMAVLMDHFRIVYQAFYPLLVISQTIPTVAIAPLLVLWFGYEMTPKIILIVITTFFPVAVGLLSGFRSVDQDSVLLLRAMSGTTWQVFRYIKLPAALGQFFAGLKISASYAVVGAVISEWLGGFSGLGVYMTRVKKAFSFDKMFAVILLISLLSLLLLKGVDLIQKKCMPWEYIQKEEM